MALSSLHGNILTILSNECHTQQNGGAGWFSSPLDILKLKEYFSTREYCEIDKENIDSSLLVIEKFNIKMTREKFSCLKPATWLNDEVINFYSKILEEYNSSQRNTQSKLHYLNTHFYGILTSNNYLNFPGADRHVKNIDVFNKAKLFIPINIANWHWVLVVVNLQEKYLSFYDSKYEKGRGSLFCANILRWIEHLAQKKKINFDITEWNIFEGAKGIPQQNNGYDCGVFIIMYMEFLSRDISLLELHCSDMENWRKKIALTILSGSLLMSRIKKRSRITEMESERSRITAAESLIRIKAEVVEIF